MIKLAVLLKRKKGMTFEEFDRYWEGQHADLVLSLSNFTRHVRRYSQSHLVDPSYGGEGLKWPRADFDGIAELWFDDIAGMVAAFNEPRCLEIIGPDDARFIDVPRTELMTVRELDKLRRQDKTAVV